MEEVELVSKAKARYIRTSPRKIRLVINLIRGERTNRALFTLANLNKRAKAFVEKALKSAISNARQNPAVKVDELFISKITADKGPILKRYRAAAMGRATMVRHRMTHLTIELSRKTTEKTKTKKSKLKKR